jgi:hypothetical protein
MTIIHRARIAATALAFTVGVAPVAYAQQPPTPAPAPDTQAERVAPAPQIEGELLSVDAETKTLTVKTDDGKMEQVRYTDDTEVTGADSGLAGLTNADGPRVSVTFTGTGADRVASEIAVKVRS